MMYCCTLLKKDNCKHDELKNMRLSTIKYL